MSGPLLEVRDLEVGFGRGGRHRVLHRVSFQVQHRQRLGLIGESGSGKSLTALAVMGLLPDSATASGSVRFRGEELLNRPDRVLARLRGDRMAMVFQEPMTALDPTMQVGRQVAEVIRLHQGAPAGTARQLVVDMLSAVDLPQPDRIVNAFPHQLSGGQRQRVVLAMALVNHPDLLICDEPTTALDVTVQAKVLRVLDAALTAEHEGCLFISHDLAVVSQVCSDVLVMLEGRIVDAGPVTDVFGQPRHPYTAGLVATARLDQVQPGQRLPTLADFYRPDQASWPR
ncbi:ABC transporter ATP-binding protein [Microlunatus panaciterrae]|uniref:ABC-type dipeptide/oligopeptide/nickel transport system ATPase component n=1 Tax=Microlunatus panaciterrae TaxID=400768 RepID=A0ABS2REQ8_9ACTN|nr:ABC transporter ATP-binding protein [Microlunatus panaciterrae]MBM7797447.1 ABC-type dipeptide/oligopeptide/nickel transport system ATPase component [Microlunatus panaciterrae]